MEQHDQRQAGPLTAEEVCHGERTIGEARARQEGRWKEEGTRAEHTRPNEKKDRGDENRGA